LAYKFQYIFTIKKPFFSPYIAKVGLFVWRNRPLFLQVIISCKYVFSQSFVSAVSILCICTVDPLYLQCRSFVSAVSILCICSVDPLYLQCRSFVSAALILCICKVNPFVFARLIHLLLVQFSLQIFTNKHHFVNSRRSFEVSLPKCLLISQNTPIHLWMEIFFLFRTIFDWFVIPNLLLSLPIISQNIQYLIQS
jgi:hypothetical protein